MITNVQIVMKSFIQDQLLLNISKHFHSMKAMFVEFVKLYLITWNPKTVIEEKNMSQKVQLSQKSLVECAITYGNDLYDNRHL